LYALAAFAAQPRRRHFSFAAHELITRRFCSAHVIQLRGMNGRAIMNKATLLALLALMVGGRPRLARATVWLFGGA
jgi:hypothetical protein